MHLAFTITFSLLAHAQDTGTREGSAERLAQEALHQRDPGAKLLVCNFSKLVKEKIFTCYSANLGPSATCDDGTRSAPFYIIEGYLDVSSQPRVGNVEYYEACVGVQG